MHSPTLLTLTAILMAMVTAVLFAVWYFNRQIPGLRLWTLSYSLGFEPRYGGCEPGACVLRGC